MRYELIDLFKQAVYIEKELNDYEKLNQHKSNYKELKQKISSTDIIYKFFKIIDNGNNILGGTMTLEEMIMYGHYRIPLPENNIKYYDFLIDEFFESYSNIKKSNYSEFEILIQADEYLDYCIFIKNELPKIKDKESVERDYLKSKFKTEQQDKIKKEGYEIWGNGGEPGPKCYDCGSTYTEYMSEGVWHCCNCDEYFEPGLF